MRLGRQTPPIYLLRLELIRSTDWHHGTATGNAEHAGRRDNMVVGHVHCSGHLADNLRQLAANWVRKGRASRSANIDAAACGTTRDYRTAAAAEEAFEEAGEAFETALTALTSVRP